MAHVTIIVPHDTTSKHHQDVCTMIIVERCVHLHIYRQYLKIEILKQHPLSRSQYHQQHTINLLLQIRPNRQILVLTVINRILIHHIVTRAYTNR